MHLAKSACTLRGAAQNAPVDQRRTIAFLRSLLTTEAPVEEIETHISHVLIGRTRVFKLKRAVTLTYVDFSTAARRLAACEAELRLNRRTAPELYVGVRRIASNAHGALGLDGEGEIIDAVVEMRPFSQSDLFDTMAGAGRLTPSLLTQLAGAIARFHAGLPSLPRDGTEALGHALDANRRGFAACGVFEATAVADLLARFDAEFVRLSRLIRDRASRGAIRRCHGDLHLRNICLFEGAPTLFDCIEFDEALAEIDVLYDLTFLLMDLWRLGLRAEANLVFNRYLDAIGDIADLAVTPFYMAVRAAVRAHVTAAQTKEHPDRVAEAQRYFDLAKSLLAPDAPKLIAVGGLSGTGKSTVAATVAPDFGRPPGARILSTDRIRKKLHGVAPETRLPPSAYQAGSSERVYAAQRDEAATVLAGGHSAMADGVFLREEEREAIEAAARNAHAPFQGFWLEAATDTKALRIASRTNDPSDATIEVAAFQKTIAPGDVRWRRVDADGDGARTRASILDALKHDANPRPISSS